MELNEFAIYLNLIKEICLIYTMHLNTNICTKISKIISELIPNNLFSGKNKKTIGVEYLVSNYNNIYIIL